MDWKFEILEYETQQLDAEVHCTWKCYCPKCEIWWKYRETYKYYNGGFDWISDEDEEENE